MKFLRKKIKLQLISRMVIVVGVFGMISGYNLAFNEPLHVSALENISVSNSDRVGITQIGAEDSSIFFVKNNRTVVGIGSNSRGELGLGENISVHEPIILPIDNVKQTSCGRGFSVFLKNDGTVWSTGWNASGQLGIGSTDTYEYSPVKIQISNVKEINCGAEYTVFLKNDGTVWSSGNFGNNRSNTPISTNISNIKKIISGRYNSILVKSDNTLLSVGATEAIGLGYGTTNSTNINVFKYSDLKQISCGYNSTLYLKNDSTVWGYGDNSMGQLGNMLSKTQKALIQLPISNVKQIGSGKIHTVFVKNDGTVWSVGDNQYGQLGAGSKSTSEKAPVKVLIDNVNQVVCGQSYTIFIKNDGTIWFSGYSDRITSSLTQTNKPILISDKFPQ